MGKVEQYSRPLANGDRHVALASRLLCSSDQPYEAGETPALHTRFGE
jgi:hypothetical protein